MHLRTHDQVLRWIREEIGHGNLRLGDRLPGERALAEKLDVSRTAVREALQILSSLGIVRSGVGSGPSAGTVIISEPGMALGSALSLHLATGHLRAEHLVEARVVVEGWAASKSALTDDNIANARDFLTQMDNPDLPVAEFLRIDADFHVLLASSSSNPLISALMGALRVSIAESTLARAEAVPQWSKTVNRLQTEHRQILDALANGRRVEATGLLREHIEGYYAETAPA